jgi:hypothetical protein
MYFATYLANPVFVRIIAFLALAGTLLPVACAMLCLKALPSASLSEKTRRTVAREAVLGAVSAALFIVVSKLWWIVLGLVFLMRFLPLRKHKFSPGMAVRKIHIAAAIPLLIYGFGHIANHLAAIDSFAVSDAVMDTLRKVYRIPAVEIFLITAVMVQVVTGARLISGSRILARSTFLHNAQILSGAYLAVFILTHVSNVVLVDRILNGNDTLFSGFTGKGMYGMLSLPNQPRLIPYYFVSVVALFVHIGAAGRWLLIPAIGSRRAEQLATAMMVAGLIAAIGVLLPMTQIHFGS